MNVTIFGASGFIGKHLFGKFSQEKKFRTTGYSSRTCNLLCLSQVMSKLSSVDSGGALVIVSGIRRETDNSFDAMSDNLKMISNCCQAIIATDVQHVTYLSAVGVYGAHVSSDVSITESTLPQPDDHYSLAKYASERLLFTCCEQRDIPVTVFRLPGVYGPGDRFQSTVGRLLECALKEKQIVIHGDGSQLRDYLFVEDIASYVQMAVIYKKNVLANLCTGTSVSVKAMAEQVSGLMPYRVKICHKSAYTSDRRIPKNLQFDRSVLDNEFSGVHTTDLMAGIKTYVSSVNLSSTSQQAER